MERRVPEESGSQKGLVTLAGYALLFLVFADLTGFGMLIPDVQLRAEHLGARGWAIGGILSAMFVTQAVVSPLWGSLSDRIGRKQVIVGCTLISALAMFIYSRADTLWIMLASRIVAGLGAGNVAAAQAAVGDSVGEDRRTSVMAKLSAAISLGLILGPAVGGFLSAWGGARLLGTVAGSISLAGALAVWALVPVSAGSSKSHETPRNLPLRDWGGPIRLLFAIAAVAWLSLACLEGTFGRLLERNFHQGVTAFSLIFSFESVLSLTAQTVLSRFKLSEAKEKGLLVEAMVLQGLGLASLALAPSMPFLVLAAGVYAVGNGLMSPALFGWCSRITPENKQGAMFGLLQSARSIGFIVGPVLGGLMFDWRPAAPYLLAGLVSLAAATVLSVGISSKAGKPKQC